MVTEEQAKECVWGLMLYVENSMLHNLQARRQNRADDKQNGMLLALMDTKFHRYLTSIIFLFW